MAQKDLMHLARNPKTAKTICTCFRQYDSWGIELDCIKVFSGNWEAISQKLLVILCVNVIATVQVPLTGSHSPSSCTPFAKLRFGICTRLSVSAFSHLHHLRPHLIRSIYLISSHSLHSYLEQSFLK